MYRNLKIVKVDYRYCDYLRKFDNKVAYNAGNKGLRPFIGVLFEIENMKYFAPLSSPKEKHSRLKNTLDLLKIDGGKFGVINFNNMIPVYENNYEELDLNDVGTTLKEQQRMNLLQNQLRWLNSNKKVIYLKSKLLYKLYKTCKLPNNVKIRCCNFPLLENKCKEYNENFN